MMDYRSATRDARAAVRLPASGLRRLSFFAVALATTGGGVWLMFDILRANGMSPLEMGVLVLFTVTFGWIALAFWSAVAGFLLQLLDIDPLSLRRHGARARTAATGPRLSTRTAVVMPVHNEEVDRVIAGLEATYNDLQATGEGGAFDFFLLSDSTDADIAAEEAAAVEHLRRRVWGTANVYYRLRRSNEGRKAGNIAEFCRRWGARYENMVVLDADSVMTGSAIVTLARAMEQNPEAGMIQTVPIPVRQETMFGRFVQFAATLYSPMLATGLAFWQTDTANYWGHNAIIRVAAFMANCGLPHLSGTPPFGGEILSHDFVEAALIRRGGWHVYLFPELEGSYEEVPANLLDFAKRDRRWAQGNLQHIKLVLSRGLHPLSRLHFVMGALAYMCSLLWLLMLVVSTVDAVSRALTVERYFGASYQLFPDWPIAKTGEMIWLLAIVAAMLLLPKAMGVLVAAINRERRAAFGGTAALVASAVVETVFSVLIAPVMMTYHAYFVASVLCGRQVSWCAQSRDGRVVSWREAAARTLIPTLVGVVWGVGTAYTTLIYFWALTPVLIGLVLAAPLIAWSSRPTVGAALRRFRIFLTPAEVRPPVVLRMVPPLYALQRERERVAVRRKAALTLPAELPSPMPEQRLDNVLNQPSGATASVGRRSAPVPARLQWGIIAPSGHARPGASRRNAGPVKRGERKRSVGS